MRAEYFSDLSIMKKEKEWIENENGERELLERYVDYKKVTFYIPKSELVREGINFDEYPRYSVFSIVPQINSDAITISKAEYEALTQGKEGWMMPENTRQALKTAIAVMADLLEGK